MAAKLLFVLLALLFIAASEAIEFREASGEKDNTCTAIGGVCQAAGEKCDEPISYMSWACGWNFMKYQCCQDPPTVEPEEDGEECGQPEVEVNAEGWRIMNGNDAERGAWPWQVSLQSFGQHFCGATIIDKYWIVSAAHCFYTPSGFGYRYSRIPTNYIQVVVGEHDTEIDDEWERIHYVKKIYVPNGYTAGMDSSPHDIALVRLHKPIQYNRNVKKACLPKNLPHDHFEGRDCWITGWGDTAGTADKRYLQQLLTPVLDQQQCKLTWGWDIVQDGMVCVGHPYHGACPGDSGGPMVCKENGKWHLAGATSWGAKDCGHMPSVYTRVSQYLDWMKQVRRHYEKENSEVDY